MRDDDFSEALSKAGGVQEFLQLAVIQLAKQVGSDACSLFIFDLTLQRLTLRATVGFDLKAIGQVSLSLDEGLVGLALKENRVISEIQPEVSPQFKLFPEMNEEPYRSFLALPLHKGGEPLGVLVLHNRKSVGFDPSQERRLRELASSLSTSVADAQMLFDFAQLANKSRPAVVEALPTKPTLLRGKSSSELVALGTVVLVGGISADGRLELAPEVSYAEDSKSFTKALKRSLEQVELLQAHTEKTLSDVASLIFSTHLLMLKDETFSGQMAALIQEGWSAPNAVVHVVNHYVEILGRSPSALLQEKAQDVQDLGHRLLRNLTNSGEHAGDYSGQIVVARHLLPSELVKISAQKAEGLLLAGVGASAHVSILAKSLGIPVLFTDDRGLEQIRTADFLILDGLSGTAHVNPAPSVVAQYRDLWQSQNNPSGMLTERHEKTFTKDGVQVHLLANINLLADLSLAQRCLAEGVGLYRSEFPFIIRNDFPTEDEQFAVYRRLLESMKGKEVVLRTLDIGGDKVLSYMPPSNETNPFLGLRALRFSLKNVAIFHNQLRALLRAGWGHELRILFPLVSSLDDFIEAKRHVDDCIRQLTEDGIRHNAQPLLGAMIELPSACEVADELASQSDFLSVGTNDLIQYLLGVDRTNEEVSGLYTAHHPAVYRTLQRVIRAAINHDTPISICGEMAADPTMIPFLIGAGIRKLSVSPNSLGQLQKTLEGLTLRECQVAAEKMVRAGTLAEIRGLLGLETSEKP